MLPKVDVALIGFEPLSQRLHRLQERLRRPKLESLVPAVRSTLDEKFTAIWPQLHRTGALRASLTKRSATGAWQNLVTRPNEAEVAVGTTLDYADAANVWPRLRDLVLGEKALLRAPDAWAELVLDRVTED